MTFSYKHCGYRIDLTERAIILLDMRTGNRYTGYPFDSISADQLRDIRRWAKKSPNGGNRECMWLALLAGVDECKELGLISMEVG